MKNIFSVDAAEGDRNPRWFDKVNLAQRKLFVREFCSKVRSRDGQAIIAISYPRTSRMTTGQLLAVYDLDYGTTHIMDLEEFTHLDVIRDAEETDYEFSAVKQCLYQTEAEDISLVLF